MNAVEIEEALSTLAAEPFDRAEFPYAFLTAFGFKDTTIRRLRSGQSNASDVAEGVLQRSNIHIATCSEGNVAETLAALRRSPKTTSAKAKFILATDGVTLEAEDISGGEHVASAYGEFANHFGFFLPLAGISTLSEIKNNPIDVKATGRLNKLYVELLKENPDWATAVRRPDMNHFMARLIFCFFAEDTDIFNGEGLFTSTVTKMSDRDGSNTHEVISAIFKAMNIKRVDRAAARTPSWADNFEYVNGGLFDGSTDVPRFTRTARSYLISTGELKWREINPDIFGSMIQAVADDEERGALGMHYTSVPNILKVLNPLFLDDLQAQLVTASDNARMLLNLRKRMSRIRVFDPACGSGNFLVIAYKEMRRIEAEVNKRRGDPDARSEIPLTNFRGIELRDFPAEIARLALIIAEYQCDVLYRGQREALKDFLPLDAENWIVCDNALRLDWLSVCPPTGIGVKLLGDDLFSTPLDQPQIDFENEGGETFICGNPPFTGTRKQSDAQKDDLKSVFAQWSDGWKNADYVSGWFVKAAAYGGTTSCKFAFVATNSVCQGQQVPIIWPLLKKFGYSIRFAELPFKWSNLASHNAGVTVVVVGLDSDASGRRYLFSGREKLEVGNINPYLTTHSIDQVRPSRTPLSSSVNMEYGVYYSKSSGLILGLDDVRRLFAKGLPPTAVRHFLGSNEFINGLERFCLWIEDDDLDELLAVPGVAERVEAVRVERTQTKDKAVQKLAKRPHQFREFKGDENRKIFVPIVSSEQREYFPAGVASKETIATNKAFYIPDAPMWVLGVIVSRIHLAWIGTVCGRLEMRYSYSNTLGWNTFPLPSLTEQNKADLTRSAESILLAREAHFPATLAELYDPEDMPEDLRRAHEENDDILERIYIGRRFRNDTERLEKLFDLYTKMIASQPPAKSKKKRSAA